MSRVRFVSIGRRRCWCFNCTLTVKHTQTQTQFPMFKCWRKNEQTCLNVCSLAFIIMRAFNIRLSIGEIFSLFLTVIELCECECEKASAIMLSSCYHLNFIVVINQVCQSHTNTHTALALPEPAAHKHSARAISQLTVFCRPKQSIFVRQLIQLCLAA